MDNYYYCYYLETDFKSGKADQKEATKVTHTTKKFWMITGDANTPRVRHATIDDAIKEARRLAKAHPGIEFYILESVELLTQPTNVVHHKL